MAADPFRKASHSVPTGYFAWEAAGLRWLADAKGAPAAEVIDVASDHLDLVRLESAAPTPGAAEALGTGLAMTHEAGSDAYGQGPQGWEGDGFLGPLSEPLPLQLRPTETWGAFFAEQRVLATLRMGVDQGVYGLGDRAAFEIVARRLTAGEFDDADRPARIHGDLWSGNVMWTPVGAVLIDPAAHGGHRETDLAMLALFGCPHFDRVVSGYESVRRLESGWRERVALHQLHPLMLHAVLFGGGYIGQSLAAASRFS